MSATKKRRRWPLLLALLAAILILLILLFGSRGKLLAASRFVNSGMAFLGVEVPPPPPSHIRAEHVAVFDILVEWQDNSNNEDGFYIYRQQAGEAGETPRVGSVGENVEAFTDSGTRCGETYRYIIASYNEAGESPATVCWEITLPPCPVASDLLLPLDAQTATDSLYLAQSDDGQPLFMADLPGQLGLFDAGEPGDIPLDQTQMPASPAYVRDGVPAVEGHRYVAQPPDGMNLILFDVNELGAAASITFILWGPGQEIDLGPCEGEGATGAETPPPDYGRLPPVCGFTWECSCGDGVFDPFLCGEGPCSCPEDFGTMLGSFTGECGDSWCACGEACDTCPEDCGPCGEPGCPCGNGICEVGCGQSICTCPEDCAAPDMGFANMCGDGWCLCGETSASCPADCPEGPSCVCGDGACQTGICGEECWNCPEDCAECPCAEDHCGDGACNCGETSQDCPADCGAPPGEGDCGAACVTSDDCREGLSCFQSVCWEDCACEGHCGEEQLGGSECHHCSSNSECASYCALVPGVCNASGCCACP
jgi:hypothetical protein